MADPLRERKIPLWGAFFTIGLSAVAVLAYVVIEYGVSALPGFLLFCLALVIALPVIALLSTS
jgi:hypothetical protein